MLDQFDLSRSRKESHGWVVPHPGREDNNPSVWITVTPDRILLCDRSGGTTDAILSVVGWGWSDLFPQSEDERCQFADLAVRLEGGGSAPTSSEKVEIDNLDLRHNVYRDMLAYLGLSDDHRKYLADRGIPPAATESREYGSLTFSGRVRACRWLERNYGNQLSLVPGFVYRDGQYHLTKAAGLMIPVRTPEGKICAVKVRQDHNKPRFLYLAGGGGPTVPNLPHFPIGFPPAYAEVAVTEGEVKADSYQLNKDEPCIGLPGMGQWMTCLPYLDNVRVVKVAFDRDDIPERQQAISACVDAFAEALYSRSIEVEVW